MFDPHIQLQILCMFESKSFFLYAFRQKLVLYTKVTQLYIVYKGSIHQQKAFNCNLVYTRGLINKMCLKSEQCELYASQLSL